VKVRIKRIDGSLPLPTYATGGSVAFDLFARETTRISPGEIALVPANVIIETPKGYALILALRSSTPRKKGLLKPHGVGIIDQDYCGEGDELKIQVYNFTAKEVIVDKGERIAQGMFVKIEKNEWEETAKMGKTRGGFGSTG